MILFVVEGERREPVILKTIEYLFLNDKREQRVIVSYGHKIYDLYDKLQKESKGLSGSVDKSSLVSLLKKNEEQRSDSKGELSSIDTYQIAEVHLFFDCEPYDNKTDVLKDMIDFFNNETEMGKLYVSYPMVEALFYTSKLPDCDFSSYTVDINKSTGKDFKEAAAQKSSAYGNYDFLLASFKRRNGKVRDMNEQQKTSKINNWRMVIRQNVAKANFICHGVIGIPENTDAVPQVSILDGQVSKYINPKKVVAILSAFPMFLFEWFGK